MIMTILLGLLGLGLLIVGAEFLVRGASKLAAACGVPALIVGLTIVAYGTSSPEMAVSVKAGLTGNADISLGNVVGSNIFNVLFILGISAVIVPLIVARQLIRLDVPVMVGVSLLCVLMAMDGKIGRIDGLILIAVMVVYTIVLIRMALLDQKSKQSSEVDEFDKEFGSVKRSPGMIFLNMGLCLGGLLLLVLGSNWFVDAAVKVAEALGVSQLVIGLTIVAAGTSMPEVATSIVAAIKKERDIAVGNVVGSNIFNILGVLGVTAAVSPDPIAVAPAMMWFDLPLMLGVALACLPIFLTGGVIARWEGCLFLAYYVMYTVYLILDASDHPAHPAFQQAMVYFVVPLTVLTLGVCWWQWMRSKTVSGEHER